MTNLFVNGTLMRGFGLHSNLEGARFLGQVRTAPNYRLHSIDDRHPGMYRVEADGVSVLGELYDVSESLVDRIEAAEPPGLYIGPVDLADGRSVSGMLYPASLSHGNPDISRYGGWRGYIRVRDRKVALPVGATGSWAWHHTGVIVADIDRAVNFYADCLGFEPVFEARGMTDLIQSVLGIPGIEADLVQCSSPLSGQVLEFLELRNLPRDVDDRLPVQPGRGHVAFLVDDLDAAVHGLVAAGGSMLGQITEFSEGRAVYCSDENGLVVELEEASSHQAEVGQRG